MKSTIMTIASLICVLVILSSQSGCTTIDPRDGIIRRETRTYTFMQRHPVFKPFIQSSYWMRNREQANLMFSFPDAAVIRFSTGGRVTIGAADSRTRQFSPGVYPFQLKLLEQGLSLSGAMIIYNIDSTVGLATLGRTPETALFNEELLNWAKTGRLASYTISLDNREILTYWLGNRTTLYAGGMPTAELDFSQTQGITDLKVNGSNSVDFVCVVPVPRRMEPVGRSRTVTAQTPQNQSGTAPVRPPQNQSGTAPVRPPQNQSGRSSPVAARSAQRSSVSRAVTEYRIEFTAGGKRYHGFVRNLIDNEFTAFVRIPCAIPQVLLDAAAAGTVSRFTVQSTGDQKENVAEIVISGM